MAEIPKSAPRIRASVIDLFQLQAGFALICLVGLFVESFPPNDRGERISGAGFTVSTSIYAAVSYVVARCLYGRAASLSGASLTAGIGGWEWARNVDSERQCIFLGIIVAILLYASLAWLDANPVPLAYRSESSSDE